MQDDVFIVEEESEEDRAFERFEKAVNTQLLKEFGVVADDLPDYDYFRAFQQKLSPILTARRAYRAAKNYY